MKRDLITPRRVAAVLIALALALGILMAVVAGLLPKPVDPPKASTSELATRADALFDQGRWLEARDVYNEMLSRYEGAGDAEGSARFLISRSTVLSLLGKPSEAEAGLRRALELLPSVAEEHRGRLEASARDRLGVVYFDMARPKEGVAEFRKAQSFWRRTGQRAKEVEVLRDLGHGLRQSGDFAAALAVLQEARAVQSRHLPDDPIAEGDLLCLKAAIDLGQGKFQDALVAFHSAEEHFVKQGDFKRSVGINLLIAHVEFAAGRNIKGTWAFQKALAVSRLDQKSFLAQYLRIYELVTLIQEHRFPEAAELCSRILPFWEKSGDRRTEALLRSQLGLLHLAVNRWKEGSAELSRSVDVFRSAPAGDRADPSDQQWFSQIKVLAFVSRMAGKWSVMNQNQREALGRMIRKMLMEQSLSQGSFHGDFEQKSRELLARFFIGDQEGTLDAMDDLTDLLEGRGRTLTESGLKTGYFAQFSWVYSHAVELNVAANQREAAFNYAEKARARAFAEEIGNQKIAAKFPADPKLIEKERDFRLLLISQQKALAAEKNRPLAEHNPDHLGELARTLEETQKEYEALRLRIRAVSLEHAHLVGLEALSLTEVQQQVLDGETTLVEYFLPESPMSPNGRGQIVAWVVERDRVTMVRLRVSTGKLRDRVEYFRELLESRKPEDARVVEVEAAKLYRGLFAPLAPHIRHSNLVIVPHGDLHFLPFAALWDGQRHLGDVYTLSYSPSATALKFVREKTARPVGPLVALGNPDGSLREATRGVKAIARLYGEKPLLGSDATEKALLDRAGKAGILHIAAHAELNSINPLFTSIRLAPGCEHDGHLEMHEVYGLDLSKTGLVVLSACETQMGKLSRGDEIEGLTRAFFYAGTPAVISSLWKVDSESTAFLMERFYTHLRKGAGRAESLRNAQAETRRRFPDPYHWAAFVLTGDGR